MLQLPNCVEVEFQNEIWAALSAKFAKQYLTLHHMYILLELTSNLSSCISKGCIAKLQNATSLSNVKINILIICFSCHCRDNVCIGGDAFISLRDTASLQYELKQWGFHTETWVTRSACSKKCQRLLLFRQASRKALNNVS